VQGVTALVASLSTRNATQHEHLLHSSSHGPTCSMSVRSAQSERATVMPPPVSGWRMLKASPSRSAPGWCSGLAGISLFCMLRMLPLSIACGQAAAAAAR
jgi:hypothetical protein